VFFSIYHTPVRKATQVKNIKLYFYEREKVVFKKFFK